MQSESPASPWYKQPWPWFILGLGTSVVLGTSMLVIAIKNPPSLVVDNYYDVGRASTPRSSARNWPSAWA